MGLPLAGESHASENWPYVTYGLSMAHSPHEVMCLK
jgi:hypothetical protein